MLMVADVLVSQADESGIDVDLDLTDDMDLVMIWLPGGYAHMEIMILLTDGSGNDDLDHRRMCSDMEMMIWLTDGCADMDLVLIWLDD